MFKNLTVYRLGSAEPFHHNAIADGLMALPFAPCMPTQAISAGFVPPRGQEGGSFAEWVAGHCIAKVLIEQRILPASVVRARVDELCAQIERESGRKPGAKRRRELKEESQFELLPQAFTRQRAVWIWFDLARGLLCIDATTNATLDAVLTLVAKACSWLQIAPLQTRDAPAACMKAWLLDGVAPAGFGIGREAVLRSVDMTGASVRYSKHSLDGQDVAAHLQQGKEVKSLALNYKDRVDFVLDELARPRKIAIDVGADEKADDVDAFDADVMLACGTLAPLLAELYQGLGGLTEPLNAETQS